MIEDRIIFIGRNTRYQITRDCFRFLVGKLAGSSHRIVGVLVSSDDGTPSLKSEAEALGLPVIRPNQNRINEPEIIEAIKALSPTILLTVQFPAIYRKDLIELPTRACLNVHRGWPLRGGSIDQRIIRERLTSYGVALHYIDEGIDTGPILGLSSFEVDPASDDGTCLDRKVADAGVRLLEDSFLSLLGRPMPAGEVQNKAKTFYEAKWTDAKKTIRPTEMSFDQVERLVRSLNHPREEGALLFEGDNAHRVTAVSRVSEHDGDDKVTSPSKPRIQLADALVECAVSKTTKEIR
jgi:methionyl-tRNA formyltransferase